MQAAGLGGAGLMIGGAIEHAGAGVPIVSPGAVKSKVRVARIYLGVPHAHWPHPKMDLDAEVKAYEAEFDKRWKAFADVDFAVSELVTSQEKAVDAVHRLADVDGVLLMHLSMGVVPMLRKLLEAGKPTMLYAAPYSGHEWTAFGAIQREPLGAMMDVVLTSDFDQLAAAIRPFRAIHHMREAKLLNVTAKMRTPEFVQAVKDKFGTEIVEIGRDRMLGVYESIPKADAENEAKRWIDGAEKVVEPSRDEIVNSCRLALAFEKLLNEEKATAITVECYGSMYRQLPAFPCIGFTRLNDMGLAGLCESDLRAGVTFMLMESLCGKPGFISDPTIDESSGGIILAHCLGSTRMEGPDAPAAPYRLRTIMERQEGAVPQVRMPVGKKATQAILSTVDQMLYFTGDAIDSPDTERGCRTKITVKVDGDIQYLWQNWSQGLHRVTCYGDLRPDLKRYARFAKIALLDEARPVAEPAPAKTAQS